MPCIISEASSCAEGALQGSPGEFTSLWALLNLFSFQQTPCINKFGAMHQIEKKCFRSSTEFCKQKRISSRQCSQGSPACQSYDAAELKYNKRSQRKTEALPRLFFGSPCWARTSDTLINSQVLVPTELRRNICIKVAQSATFIVSALTYFPGPSPAKYFRHCKA